MTHIKYTPEQASAVSTVASAGSLNPRRMYEGYMRFHGVCESEPGQHASITETVILDNIRPTDTDPITARKRRAQNFEGIWRVIEAFSESRRFTSTTLVTDLETNPLLPYDLLGTMTRDPAGQAVLMYWLTKHAPHHEIVLAFSIPFTALGERLLHGELISLRDAPLRGAAVQACESFGG